MDGDDFISGANATRLFFSLFQAVGDDVSLGRPSPRWDHAEHAAFHQRGTDAFTPHVHRFPTDGFPAHTPNCNSLSLVSKMLGLSLC